MIFLLIPLNSLAISVSCRASPEASVDSFRVVGCISPDKARKGVIYPLKTGIYALVGISERTFTR